MRILLADDNPKIRAALRLLTEELGHTTCEAIDVDTLLQHLRDHPVDLLLLDWELPGFSPAVHMQDIRRLSPCCVVAAMSGRPEARTESGRLGAEAFLGKNDPPDRLLQLLREVDQG